MFKFAALICLLHPSKWYSFSEYVLVRSAFKIKTSGVFGVCNPSQSETEVEDYKFKASLDYLVKPRLKKKF
jgi:hypothetical protein